jgi:hypothetical protein
MLYRIAVGVGLFLLGYALGRRTQDPADIHEHTGTKRIRDSLAERKDPATQPRAERSEGTDPESWRRPSSDREVN